jgi:RNase P subunit RPR2
MTQIFDNAVASLRLGIEDFKTGNDDRMLSAARNYYAGLLLLAKECLVKEVPKADAMEVIGAKFKPKPDGEGGVVHVPEGYTTVDLNQLKKRFNDFGLNWPNADIKKLQEFRNDLEHLHLKEPVSLLKEAIASSFPMIVDFFAILKENPKSHLKTAWDTVLSEHKEFVKAQKACVESLEKVEWPANVCRLDRLSCPSCKSSLVGQENVDNISHKNVVGICSQCGEEIDFAAMMQIIVEASYGYNTYSIVKDGGEPPVTACPECSEETYVEEGEVSVCFNCGESVAGECAYCNQSVSVNDWHYEYSDLCSYCGHMAEKAMRE